MFSICKRFASYFRKELIKWKAARSSGPGGQHANTNNTKATLLYPLSKIESRLHEFIKSKPSQVADGHFVVSSQKHRSLEMNIKECLKIFEQALKDAAIAATPKETPLEQKLRVQAFRARGDKVRLDIKRHWSEKKQQRQINKKDLFS